MCDGSSCVAIACGASGEGCCEDTACNAGLTCTNGICGSPVGPDAGVVDFNWSQWVTPPDHPLATEYSASVDGSAVTDSVTKLTWQSSVGGPFSSWADAQSYCATLSLPTYSSGWELPAYIELLSIVDYGASNPAINDSAFPQTPSTWFWTSTAVSFSPGSPWFVDFGAGGSYDISTPSASVRCVHRNASGGVSPTDRFQVSSSTVYDVVGLLTWQEFVANNPCPNDPAGVCTEAHAAAYCKSLSLGGFSSGWRLPTLKELTSIVDIERESPAIDLNSFPGTRSTWFWSSSAYLGATGDGWCTDFNEGGVSYSSGPYATGADQYVRCVR